MAGSCRNKLVDNGGAVIGDTDNGYNGTAIRKDLVLPVVGTQVSGSQTICTQRVFSHFLQGEQIVDARDIGTRQNPFVGIGL